MEQIVEWLKHQQYRDTTRKNYYSIWKSFNTFYLRLDKKPKLWEDRIVLFIAHLIQNNKQASTVKSYISAIKAVLAEDKITLNQDDYLIKSLTRACKLNNSNFRIQLPIQKGLLNILIKSTEWYFLDKGQVYLTSLYTAMLSTAYYGLLCISKIAKSQHVLKAMDIHVAVNKRKMLFGFEIIENIF